jgi:hypothetical protein
MNGLIGIRARRGVIAGRLSAQGEAAPSARAWPASWRACSALRRRTSTRARQVRRRCNECALEWVSVSVPRNEVFRCVTLILELPVRATTTPPSASHAAASGCACGPPCQLAGWREAERVRARVQRQWWRPRPRPHLQCRVIAAIGRRQTAPPPLCFGSGAGRRTRCEGVCCAWGCRGEAASGSAALRGDADASPTHACACGVLVAGWTPRGRRGR